MKPPFCRGEVASPNGLGAQLLQMEVEYGKSTYRLSAEIHISTYGLDIEETEK